MSKQPVLYHMYSVYPRPEAPTSLPITRQTRMITRHYLPRDLSSMSPTKKQRPKGIYLLPNLFTIAALFAGFYAVVAAMKGFYHNAAIAIFIALVMDGLDGRVARLTQTQSDFGAELDSLSDMVSFGVAPGLILYSWSLHQLGKGGWLIAFTYTAATALRLARFNVSNALALRGYFHGMPTPPAAATIASVIWLCQEQNISGTSIAIPIAFLAIALAILKVSSIPFRSFKDLNIQEKVPFMAILLVVLVVVLISFEPPEVFLLVFGSYMLSGPISYLWRRMMRKRKQRQNRS